MAPRPTQLYPGGPVRLYSTDHFRGSIPYDDGVRRGFIGPYLCSACKQPTLRGLAGAGRRRCLACNWVTGGRKRRGLEAEAAAHVVRAFSKARQEFGLEDDE
jgi:hypothetical protein